MTTAISIGIPDEAVNRWLRTQGLTAEAFRAQLAAVSERIAQSLDCPPHPSVEVELFRIPDAIVTGMLPLHGIHRLTTGSYIPGTSPPRIRLMLTDRWRRAWVHELVHSYREDLKEVDVQRMTLRLLRTWVAEHRAWLQCWEEQLAT